MDSVKVLVADDDRLNRMMIIKLLNKYGAECTPAENGREAIEKAVEGDFDVIFLDCNMPVFSGIECADLIKKHYSTSGRKAPLLVGASADENNRVHEHFDEFLSKPFRIERIREILSKVSGEDAD